MQGSSDNDRREQSCPLCGATIPIHPGYVTWCDLCAWNLKPHKAPEPKTPYKKLSAKMGKRLGEDLYRRVRDTERIESHLNGSKIAAYALATMVHGVSVVFIVLGIYLLISGWPNIILVFAGALMLSIGIASRPRPGKPAKTFTSREAFPELHRVVDRVTETLGAPKVDSIILSPDFNASYGTIGWRRRRELRLGIPLVEIYESSEFIGLLGHELGHSINKDSTRGFYLSSAIHNLDLWYRLMCPEHILSSEGGAPALLVAPFNLAFIGLAQIPRVGAQLMAILVYRDSQRAEYLADYLASVAAGKSAAISMLHKLQFRDIYQYAVQRTALNGNARPLFDELAHQIAAMPAREIERIRRVGLMEESALDDTHPPTHQRIGFIEKRGELEGRVKLTDSEWQTLKREIAQVHGSAEKFLLEEYRASIH